MKIIKNEMWEGMFCAIFLSLVYYVLIKAWEKIIK